MMPIAAPEQPTTLEESGQIISLFTGAAYENANDAYRLDRAIKRVRKLLDDPVALMARAQALLDGTAKPLLALVVIGLTVFRMVGGPPSNPSYYLSGAFGRRNAVIAVASQPTAAYKVA